MTQVQLTGVRARWRRYVYPNGTHFGELRSHRTILGLPLMHYTSGRCPETGRRIVAKGILAVGRLAVGVVFNPLFHAADDKISYIVFIISSGHQQPWMPDKRMDAISSRESGV